MKRPPKLKPGDTVGLIAPARKVQEEVIQTAEKVLRSWGLQTTRASGLTSTLHSYHGASIEERITDFQNLLDTPGVKAILCLRGGYGSNQFVDQIRWDDFKINPKWLIGFSDVTALHLQAYRLGVESIHSLMALQFADERQRPALERLKEMIFGNDTQLRWESGASSIAGECTAPMIGGNLSLLIDSLATASELHTFGHILFIEEVDEPFYKVDRMLTHLKRARKLDKIKGLVVGYMTDIKDTDIAYGQTIERVILDKIPSGIPVSFGCPSGHEPPNMPWRHGATVTLKVDRNFSSIESSHLV